MIKIREDFKKRIFPLTPEEFAQLEENILKEGIREPILTWQNVIVDGHNRYEIAQKHNLKFLTAEVQFADDNECQQWMIKNQFGRRNLQKYQRSVLALALEDLYKEKIQKEKSQKISHYRKTGEISQISEKPDRYKEIGTLANVSHDTIAKVKVIEAKAAPEIKQKLSTGEVSINQVYQEIKKEEKQKVLEEKKKEYIQASKTEIKNYPEVEVSDAISFLNKLANDSIDLLITDPPYSTDIDDIKKFTFDWVTIALQKVKKSGRIYICAGAYPKELQAFLDVLMSQDKFIVDNPLIWTYRNTLGLTPKMKYNLNYQIIWHLYSQQSNELDTSITNEMFAVQDINAPDGRIGNRLHTWQKPDELAYRLIRHGSKIGDIVVDCFCCTGTFLLAASKFGRISKGCDIDEQNLQIAKQRGCTILGK